MGWGDGHWGEMPWGGGVPSGVDLAPPAGILSFSSAAPTLTNGQTLSPPAASLSFLAVAPSLLIGGAITIAAPAARLTLQAVAPGVFVPSSTVPLEPIRLLGSHSLLRRIGSTSGAIRKVGSP